MSVPGWADSTAVQADLLAKIVIRQRKYIVRFLLSQNIRLMADAKKSRYMTKNDPQYLLIKLTTVRNLYFSKTAPFLFKPY